MRWTALAIASLALVACDGGEQGHDRLSVVATFYPVAELASRVGGDLVRATNLTPAGVEPHDLELTSQQVDSIEDARVVLYVGRGFQPAVAEVARRRSSGSVDLLGAGEVDPHFWLDPRRMAQAVETVVDALTKAAPGDARTFRANADRYRAELAALDREFEQGLASCERQEIVTAHEAFGRLADRYGLVQVPIAGISPEAEADAARFADLADLIKARGITTVFFEELAPADVARTLAREAGVGTAVLDPVEGLSPEDVAAGKDYLAVMRDNLAALRAALSCR